MEQSRSAEPVGSLAALQGRLGRMTLLLEPFVSCQVTSDAYARDGSETDGGVCAIKQEKVLSRISSRLRTRQTGLEMEGELLVRAVADG